MTVLVFANGEITDVDWVRPLLSDSPTIIAADGGLKHVQRLGILPQVVIGDMDSLAPYTEDDPDLRAVEFIKFPSDKDETDLELALRYAISNYKDDIQVLGAFGGRIDQTVANILVLTHPQLQSRRIEILENRQSTWICHNDTIIDGQIGDIVSLIPLNGNVRFLATEGLKWPLNDETIPFGRTRGISNVMTANKVTIKILDGTLLCVHQRQEIV